MARNFFWIFTENKLVRGLRKKYNIPKVNWLTDGGKQERLEQILVSVSRLANF